MLKVILVGIGGFCGAFFRYTMSVIFAKYTTSLFFVSTLLINVLGAFFIGMLSAYSAKISPLFYLFLTIGVLGGFTTFSTFSLETVQLFENGRIIAALINILLSITLCLFGVIAGKFIIKLIN